MGRRAGAQSLSHTTKKHRPTPRTSSNSKIVRLFDLNGNKEYGTFVSGRRDPRYGAPLRGELGLSTVKRIVDLHGGRITVQTEGLPTGAIFRMTLPAIGQRETVTAPVE
jgi:hypothetical protein